MNEPSENVLIKRLLKLVHDEAVDIANATANTNDSLSYTDNSFFKRFDKRFDELFGESTHNSSSHQEQSKQSTEHVDTSKTSQTNQEQCKQYSNYDYFNNDLYTSLLKNLRLIASHRDTVNDFEESLDNVGLSLSFDSENQFTNLFNPEMLIDATTNLFKDEHATNIRDNIMWWLYERPSGKSNVVFYRKDKTVRCTVEVDDNPETIARCIIESLENRKLHNK